MEGNVPVWLDITTKRMVHSQDYQRLPVPLGVNLWQWMGLDVPALTKQCLPQPGDHALQQVVQLSGYGSVPGALDKSRPGLRNGAMTKLPSGAKPLTAQMHSP